MEINQNANGRGALEGGVRTIVIVTMGLLALFLLAKSINEFRTYSVIGRDVAVNNTITVSGKGEAVGVPDIATFTFGVTAESLSVSEAQDKSAKSVNAIMDFLTKNGVDKKDIKTIGYNIHPRYEWVDQTMYRSGRQVLAAYVISQTTEVKVRKLADAGKLLGGIGELGATDASSLTFSFDEEEGLKAQARSEAVTEAKKTAVNIANSLGVSLGRVVSFNETGSPVYPMYRDMAAQNMMKLESAASVPDVAPGENKIISNVTITYELK